MATINIKYLVIKRWKGRSFYYWQPKAKYKIGGQWIDCPFASMRVAKETNREEDACSEATLLNDQLTLWRNGEPSLRTPRKGTVHWLAVEYFKDEMFTSLSAKSQHEYRRLIERELLPIFADIPYERVSRKQARAFYQNLSHKPRVAQYTVMVARRLFHFGRNIDALKDNPFTEMGIKKPQSRELLYVTRDSSTYRLGAKILRPDYQALPSYNPRSCRQCDS